ncbi:hypothetical protein [Corynebacterium heidelbergense]|uniref:Uncharacterized protein n=1 Tax=Corynebacterium heidelbergense TaxID=2055947 RepID=A0A364V647_9CORY|nr:hypothetical protein [Corynebacterium heidelbergense]RAV32088.1 hypothetical protein DLJ54_04995 [Corynebacterium heidelbergense]
MTTTQAARSAFIGNLTAMATGSYLRPADREFWEPPYPQSVVREATAIVDHLIAAIASVGQHSPEQLRELVELPAEQSDGSPDPLTIAICAIVDPDLARLKALSAEHEDAVLDCEEQSDLMDVLASAAKEAGADPAAVLAHATQVLDDE